MQIIAITIILNAESTSSAYTERAFQQRDINLGIIVIDIRCSAYT